MSTVQLDDTDKLAVSVYGKASAAGDTALAVGRGSGYADVVKVLLTEYGGEVLEAADGPVDSVNANRNLATAVWLFNGSAFDRQRNNTEVTLLASAARTAETNSADQTNYNGKGLLIYVDWTVETDTVTLTPKLQVKDSIGGGYFTVWSAAAALTAIGDAVYLFQPGGAAGSYTEAVNLRVGRTWRFQMGVGDTDEATYSVSAVVLV